MTRRAKFVVHFKIKWQDFHFALLMDKLTQIGPDVTSFIIFHKVVVKQVKLNLGFKGVLYDQKEQERTESKILSSGGFEREES